MEKPSQWVSKLCRLYFAEEYARRTVGIPSTTQVPGLETALNAVQNILPKLEARTIEFLAEWLVTLLNTSDARIGSEGTSSFLYVPYFSSAPVAFSRIALETPEWTSRDSNHHRQSVSAGKTNAIPTEPSGRLHIYLGLKVTASFGRSESYTRVIDGQVRNIQFFLRTVGMHWMNHTYHWAGLSIAVRQICSHRTATIEELDNMLQEFDSKRSSVAINRNVTEWAYNSRKHHAPVKFPKKEYMGTKLSRASSPDTLFLHFFFLGVWP